MRIRDEGTLESLVAFFTQSDHMRLGFCPLYGETGKDMLFVSVPVRLGLTKDDVLLFFQLDEGAIHSAYFSPPGAQAAQYAVLRRDTSEMLYTIGGDYVKSASLGVPSNGAPVQRRTDGGVEYRVITSDSKALGYRYVGILPSDALMQKVDAFYQIAVRLLVVFAVTLVALTALMIYVNYQPIYRLVRELTRPSGVGELDPSPAHLSRSTMKSRSCTCWSSTCCWATCSRGIRSRRAI